VTALEKRLDARIDAVLALNSQALGDAVQECWADVGPLVEEKIKQCVPPIRWNEVLDGYERRIQALEAQVCKCGETKPWAKGKGTKREPMEILDDEEGDEGASSSRAEDPPSSDDSYNTPPPIADPVVVDERVDGKPAFMRVGTPHASTQVGYAWHLDEGVLMPL